MRVPVRIKRRVLVVVLAALAVWPLAHHALVRVYGVNPERFFGWATYSVPRRFVFLHRFLRQAGVDSPLPYPEEGPPPEVVEWIERRVAQGALLPPDEIAARLFEERPDFPDLRLVVEQLEFDRESARYRAKHYEYDYPRPRSAKRPSG